MERPMIETYDDDAPTTRRYRHSELRDRKGAAPESASTSMHRTSYEVTITYREPGYALYVGGEGRSYSATFTVLARDNTEATARARAQFDDIAARSGVSWVREIEAITCRPAAAAR